MPISAKYGVKYGVSMYDLMAFIKASHTATEGASAYGFAM